MIKEEREEIITNNNTAEKQFYNYLETLTKPIKKVEFKEPLYGDIDFATLKEKGLGVPEEIIFKEGKITNLYNLPQGLLHLQCNNNLLLTIENLPSSLHFLDLEYNYLDSLDVSGLKELETLIVSHNQLSELSDLPNTLQVVKATYNKLEKLDLSLLDKLQVLHISNNMITLIENMQENIDDFQMENTPTIEFRNVDMENIKLNDDEKEGNRKKKKEYDAALKEYFKMKAKYENKLHDLKKKAFDRAPTKKIGSEEMKKVRPPCVKCKRNVGTVFNYESNKYTAVCGDAREPCKLNIQLYNGIFYYYQDLLNLFEEPVEDLKKEIIRNKLDNIFGYIDDEESKHIHDTKMTEYDTDSKTHQEILDKYNEVFNNEDKKEELIQKKKELFVLIEQNKEFLEEYKENQNKELLKQVVVNNKNNISRISKIIQNLENEIIEVNYYKEGYYEDNRSQEIYKLFQYPISLTNIEMNWYEPQNVIKFDR
jgi:hypothetical protein|tara:strand:+ start:32 stop:1477 length:1446 start_codon:yes stop_codon:yes gene_type:complete